MDSRSDDDTGHDTDLGRSVEAVAATPDTPSTLSEEHALLIREVTTRAEAVVRETDADRWPGSQLRELVNYLHLEVLQQIVDEEWLLFRGSGVGSEGLARLRRAHLELRLTIDQLTQAAMAATLSPAQLAATTQQFISQLKDHMAAEEKQLAAASSDMAATTSLGRRPHEWYDLTEGPVIDLDRLPGEQGVDAALARLLRLHRGEQVELRASGDPGPLWQRLLRADPGAYGVALLEHGPPLWRVQVTRRLERWTPRPQA